MKNLTLDEQSSRRLTILRFPLIVCVVFIHAYASNVVTAEGAVGVTHPSYVADFLRNFVSQGVARVAVPLFFLISAYLFFFGIEWSKHSYLLKLTSRVRTLLIPFIFWNVVTLMAIALAQHIPATKVFFSGGNPLIATYGFFEFIDAIFGITRSPIAYQFWFIRDLILLVLLTPAIYLLIKHVPLICLSLLSLNWLLELLPLSMPSPEALLFFSVGACFGLSKKSLFSHDKYGVVVLVSYLVVVTVSTVGTNQPFQPYLHKLGIVLGVLSALYSSKLVMRHVQLSQLLIGLSASSFFVYAAHEPLLTVLRKISFSLVQPANSLSVLALYFLIPTITILLTIFAYRVSVQVVPKFTRMVVGGR
jgi:surface polysaccharide O-acyltransferase-like enzyme